jgi:hypothetical protein
LKAQAQDFKIVRSCTCRLLSLPEVKISLKRAAFQTVEEIQCTVTRELNNISKNCFSGGHEEVEGTSKQMY